MSTETQYALHFQGHHFEYEIQAVTKLFIPGVRFALYHEDEQPQEVNVIFTGYNPEQGTFLVSVLLNGRQLVTTQKAVENPSQQEYQLCHMLYDLLKQMTGYQPPWGMLTGIRPVRKVLDYREQGLSSKQVCQTLQEKFDVSDEKVQLALKTAEIQENLLPHSNKEIGLYIAVPFCPSRCSYCSFVSHSIQTAGDLIPAYVEKLREELKLLGTIIQKYALSVQTVYIGGGTPTAVSAEQLQQIMQAVQDYIAVSEVKEYTVEAGRADTITKEKLQVIKTKGATRISVNPQTLQDSVLQAIGRNHTAQQAVEAFQLARKMGFSDINMDLIAGLPTDTFEGFSDTLHKVLALAPDSITVHCLTLKRSADLYKSEETTPIPEIEKMAELSAGLLPEHGYQPYYLYRQKNTVGNLENVGYARNGRENLYNILIMDDRQTILGAGCGASSKIVLPDGNLTRVMNYKYPYEYINRFSELMQKKQQIEAELEKL